MKTMMTIAMMKTRIALAWLPRKVKLTAAIMTRSVVTMIFSTDHLIQIVVILSMPRII